MSTPHTVTRCRPQTPVAALLTTLTARGPWAVKHARWSTATGALRGRVRSPLEGMVGGSGPCAIAAARCVIHGHGRGRLRASATVVVTRNRGRCVARHLHRTLCGRPGACPPGGAAAQARLARSCPSQNYSRGRPGLATSAGGSGVAASRRGPRQMPATLSGRHRCCCSRLRRPRREPPNHRQRRHTVLQTWCTGKRRGVHGRARHAANRVNPASMRERMAEGEQQQAKHKKRKRIAARTWPRP